MKPKPNKIKKPAALQKTEIRKITEITGFTESITKILENSVPHANKSMKKFVIFKRICLFLVYT
jgi:hypothetical protein